MSDDAPLLITVGHSNHPLEHFLALLARHRIQAIADVRSWPRSRHAPWFDQAVLRQSLRERGMGYVFLGRELGGRPDGAGFYDGEGHVRYDQVAQSELFAAGMQRLLDGAEDMRVAVMCAEENPTDCHRRLLVARVALRRGVRVEHVRGDGRIEPEPGFAEGGAQQLFPEERSWISTRSVLRRPRLSTSSGV